MPIGAYQSSTLFSQAVIMNSEIESVQTAQGAVPVATEIFGELELIF